MSQPETTKGKANLTTCLLRGKSPANKINTNGKSEILWYQHKEQGAYPMTSLKNMLPRVEAQAISQHINNRVQF